MNPLVTDSALEELSSMVEAFKNLSEACLRGLASLDQQSSEYSEDPDYVRKRFLVHLLHNKYRDVLELSMKFYSPQWTPKLQGYRSEITQREKKRYSQLQSETGINLKELKRFLSP